MMFKPWLCVSLIVAVFVLLFIVAYLLIKYNNKDLPSLVGELSYEEKRELEKSLKKDRIMAELLLCGQFLEAQDVDDMVELEFHQHKERLKTRGPIRSIFN